MKEITSPAPVPLKTVLRGENIPKEQEKEAPLMTQSPSGLQQLKNMIKAQARKIRRLEIRGVHGYRKNQIDDMIQKSSKFLNKGALDFFSMQLEQSLQKRRRWSPQNKAYSLALYHSSAKTYSLLRKKFILPSIETLRKMMKGVDIYPGNSLSLYS